MNAIDAKDPVKWRDWVFKHFKREIMDFNLPYLRCKHCHNGLDPDAIKVDALNHARWCPNWPKNG